MWLWCVSGVLMVCWWCVGGVFVVCLCGMRITGVGRAGGEWNHGQGIEARGGNLLWAKPRPLLWASQASHSYAWASPPMHTSNAQAQSNRITFENTPFQLLFWMLIKIGVAKLIHLGRTNLEKPSFRNW